MIFEARAYLPILLWLVSGLVGFPAQSAAAAEPSAQRTPAVAERIVSLAPSVTETLFALGAQDQLVAVSRYCDHPPAAQELPRAGDYLRPSIETIVAMQPDVVIGVETPANREKIEEIQRLGIRVEIVPEHSLDDAFRSIRAVGALAGRTREAEALVRRLRAELEAVRISVADRPRRRVLVVVGHDPLIAVGQGLYLDELIEIAGGTNVTRSLGRFARDAEAAPGESHAAAMGPWPRLSLETVIAAGPEVIIDGAMGTESGASVRAWWARFASVPAVRDGRIRQQEGDSLLRPGPRLGEAARELARLIHSDAPSAP